MVRSWFLEINYCGLSSLLGHLLVTLGKSSHRFIAESEFPCLCNTYFTCLLWRLNKNMYRKPLTWYMTGGRYKVTDLLNTSIRVFTLYVQIFPSSPLCLLFLGRFILKTGTGMGLLSSLLQQSPLFFTVLLFCHTCYRLNRTAAESSE